MLITLSSFRSNAGGIYVCGVLTGTNDLPAPSTSDVCHVICARDDCDFARARDNVDDRDVARACDDVDECDVARACDDVDNCDVALDHHVAHNSVDSDDCNRLFRCHWFDCDGESRQQAGCYAERYTPHAPRRAPASCIASAHFLNARALAGGTAGGRRRS